MSANLLKKLTMKNIVGDTKKLAAALFKEKVGSGETVMIARFLGKATGWAVKSTDLGESIAIKGSFAGINLMTGEEFRAMGGTCYLPEAAAGLIAATLEDDNAESVDFAFEIGMKESETAIRGFEYVIKPLIEPAEDDALARLSKSLPALPKATQKAIDAPSDKKAK